MRGLKLLITELVVFFIALDTSVCFSQNDTSKEGLNLLPPAAQSETQLQGIEDSDMQWVWGEVVSVNAENNMLTVSHLDYETDLEKEIKLSVDDKTSYENVASLKDIKVHDTVSIDYVDSDGKYIAKNISIEKPEETLISPEGNTEESEKR